RAFLCAQQRQIQTLPCCGCYSGRVVILEKLFCLSIGEAPKICFGALEGLACRFVSKRTNTSHKHVVGSCEKIINRIEVHREGISETLEISANVLLRQLSACEGNSVPTICKGAPRHLWDENVH